jgi:PA14 domain
MKALRTIAALFVALTVTLLPLLVVTTAWASPLDDAQAALYAGQQELINATLDKHDVDALVDSAYLDLQAAQTAVAAAQTDYDTNLIPQVTSGGSGLSVDIYNNTTNRNPDPANLCRHDTVSQISANWGSGPVMGCNSDRVTVHYYGTLTVPTSGPYMFRNIADDGFYMTLDGNLVINDWRDKGCGGNWYSTQLQSGHAYVFDAWYYENGGGACSTLYYQGNNNFAVVPASWFGQTSVTTMVPDPAKLEILTAAQSALASAQTAYDAALAAQVTAALRLQAASDAIPALEQAVLDATPVVVPQPIDTATPLPTETPQSPQPTTEPSTTPDPVPSTTAEPSPEPQPSQPEPVVVPVVPEPSPAPAPVPVPEPVVPPVVEPPVIVPAPQPQPIPYPVEPMPVVTPPAPVETPAPTPVPLPSESPSEQPTSAPVPVETPAPVPVPVVTETPATPPVPPVVPPIVPSEPPVVEPTKDVSNIATVDLKAIDPQSLSTAEVAQLVSAAVEVLATASEGSPQYEKALDALAVAAQADDPQVPEALANIPGVGQAAVAVLNAFNALGNFGADMSPAHRKTAKKEVVAAIVLTQVTSAAVGAATSAASSPSSRKTK